MGNGFDSGGYNFDNDVRDDFDDDFADTDFYDDFDERSDSFDDDFDDYSDSGMNSRSSGYSQSSHDEFDDDFDDDFDSDRTRYDDYNDYNVGYGNYSRNSKNSDYDDGYGVNYDDFEDKSYYNDGMRSKSAARNVVPEQRRHETQSERYDRYAEDLKKKKKNMGAPNGTTGDFYDYDTSSDYDDYYDDADGYYGRDYGPADRTPEPIPPIYAKYLGYGSGGEYTGGEYEEQYGKTAKKNNSISLKNYRTQKRLKTMGIVMGCMMAVCAVVYYFAFVHIYNPVNIDNSIVNLQTADTTKMMQSVVGNVLSDKTLNLTVSGETFTINLGEYDFNYSSSADGSTSTVTVKDSEGNDTENVIATYKNICYNQTKMEELLNNISDKYGTTMVKPSYTIEEDQLIITAGSDGIGVDENSLIGEILARIQSGNYDDRIVQELVVTKAPAVDIDQIYKEVVCEVQDASSYVDENGETVYTPDVVGKKFNLEDARAKIANGGNKWSISMSLTQPKVTLVELKAPTCPDLLADCTTTFLVTNKTRVANIKNAANRINTYGSFDDGYILQPGEIFSFNDVVGERTEANGFSMATVYTTSGTASDVGGGICQVSSTLFSAVFKADLEIVSRTNHMYIVHYWNTKGEDATVNWGTIDFKFQNSKSYPIKIKFSVDTTKGSITCQVYGTDDGYRAEFDNKVLSMTLASVVTKNATSSKPAGTVEYGDPGYVVEIYKVRYYNDVKISKELMWTSTYVPLDTVKYQ